LPPQSSNFAFAAPKIAANLNSNAVIAATKETVVRPPKRARHPPKTTAKEEQTVPETPISKIRSNEPSLSASKTCKTSHDPVSAPLISPISKVEPTEAFHSGSNVSRKNQVSQCSPLLQKRILSVGGPVPVKTKLLTVPAEKCITAETAETANNFFQAQQKQSHGSCQEQTRSEYHLPRSNIEPPAHVIPTPTRLICQFESAPIIRQAPSHSRSIGIQVELQDASDIKLM